MIKIGISGKMRSGKGTIANTIGKRMLEFGVVPGFYSLAKPLKEFVQKGLGRSDREAYQIFGTEVVREGCLKYFGTDNVWVNYLINTVKEESGVVDVAICDDVRFPNEADAMKKDGWILWRVETTKEEQLARPIEGQKKTENLEHASETSLDSYTGFDLVIPAGLDLNSLERYVIQAIDTFIIPQIPKLDPESKDWKPVTLRDVPVAC